jgi:hypothetical protein
MRSTFAIGLGVVLALCVSIQAQQKTIVRGGDPPDENPKYFPASAFSQDSDLGDFTARWYAKHLRAMAEPSLLEASKDKKLVVYRFLWLRTFNQPISIRLSIRPTGAASLTTVVTSGKGGYQPGIVSKNKVTEVSTRQLKHFYYRLDEVGFWSMKTLDEANGGDDGAEWILEGIKDGNYHIVTRWTPESGNYRKLCLDLVELSDLTFKPNDIY